MLKLPPPHSAIFRPNVQLPDLVDPLPLVPKSMVSGLEEVGVSGLGLGGANTLGTAAKDVACSVGSQAANGAIRGDCVPSGSGQMGDTPMCHDVCFAGLGGDVVCLFSESDDVQGEGDLGSGTHGDIASVHVVDEIFGEKLDVYKVSGEKRSRSFAGA